jgi:hypothetical protein
MNVDGATRIEICVLASGESLFVEDVPTVSAATARLLVEHAGYRFDGEPTETDTGWWQFVTPISDT